jgi:hypothetical protein
MEVLVVVATVSVGVTSVVAAFISTVKWIYRRGETAGYEKAHQEAEKQAQLQFAAELNALKQRLSELESG